MAELVVLGVRHHSPACARLVAHVIDELRPRFVLIEGPCDMNERMGELAHDHRLPIAIYSYRLTSDGRRSRASWSPFCDYSPEWVAAKHGKAVGSEVLFVDLPAWDEAFENTENTYSDAHLNVSSRLREIAHDLGFDSIDTLWDHLFEQPKEPRKLQTELAEYFENLRADEVASEGDAAREAWMAQWIAWAMSVAAKDESVVVVCGGYHKPALERAWVSAPAVRPEIERPVDRVGSYLVPFSFRRLDSFTGYASGMPSPAFYQEAWESGADCADTMLFRAVRRLREKRQRVSTADALAASELMRGLAQLRGHSVPLRADVLDGLVGALVKEALSAPAPWSTRGVLPRGTDPMLVEMVAAFSGDARGELAPETPRPPLLHDVERELERVGLQLAPNPKKVVIDTVDPSMTERRQVLYRLAILEVPGVALVSLADLRRGVARTTEEWRLQRDLETESTLIERAVYGATLEQAALARILEHLQSTEGVASIARALERALLAGYRTMATDLVARARDAIVSEVEFDDLGEALGRFLGMTRAATEPALHAAMASLTTSALERSLWLLEGLDGSRKPYAAGQVRGVTAIRDVLREPQLAPPDVRAASFDLLVRRASTDHAPPAIQGACLGALWSIASPDAPTDEARAAATVGAVEIARLGDFLSGLFALAREEFLASSLLDIVDGRMTALGQEDFLIVLPSLRQAFSFFPPRERLDIAKRLVKGHGLTLDAGSLLRSPLSAEEYQRASRLQKDVFALAEAYGLLGGGGA
ncbi:hypothetical protein AKJ09_11430 [Labilithrix luteola]|uniref:Uncharacterized protein n=1 Tax=Labilithrix luteola TaxID=1391654 RepID=A0A0K1QGJ2_9BACT|nr:DUF5682 family protein [Labilithrix luteola]AKV04767.1 hypothetical protein AKJ09_11430 [Labilithrix luteola]